MAIGIFVGGTYKGNEDFRNAVYEVFRGKPVQLITMEDFPSTEKTPPELCRDRLGMASYYILIVKNRYGWIPPGYDKAITELEYEWAIELKLPQKIYIYEPENDALLTDIDNKERLNAFKKRLETHSPRKFKNVDELKYLVLHDYDDWLRTSGYLQYTPTGTNIIGLDILTLQSTNQFTHTNIDSNFHKEQLGDVYEEQLNKLVNQRIMGDIDGAWEELKKALEDFTVRRIPDEVAARYYLMAAQWALADFSQPSEANRYFKRATTLHKGLDTRSFRAKIFAREGKFNEALSILKPLDKENVLNTALHILFEQGKGYMAEDILAQASVKPTHATRHILSLCNIQECKLSNAEAEIQKAIADFPNSPVYHLVAGLIDYWRAIPEDISDAKGIAPVFINTDSFVPTAEQTEHLEAALKHFERARELTASHNNRTILNEISQAWILTACLLPYKKKDADRTALEILKYDPGNSVILLYAAEHKLELDDECLALLKRLIMEGRANLNHIAALTRIHLNKKEGKKALDILNTYKKEFIEYKAMEPWIHFMAEAYMLENRFNEAELLLDSVQEVDINIRNRIRSLIYERQGRKDELIELARSLAVNPGTRLDMSNLAHIYRRYGHWDKVIESAQALLEHYQDISAVELLAEAQLRVNRPEDCLHTLEKYEQLFPDSKLSIQSKLYKLDAFRMLSRIDDASSLADNIWEEYKNGNMVVTRARLHILNGDTNSAIGILKDGINKGFENLEINLMLAELVKTEYPSEAFRYAKKAIDLSPENPSAYVFAIMLGYNTGNDYEASRLLMKFNEKFPGSNLIKSIPTTELIPISKEWNEASKQRWQFITEGQIPLHLVLDMENTPMGLDFYWRWTFNRKVDYKSQAFLPCVFGGRPEIDTGMLKQGRIFMDYSACLVAHALELFDSIKRAFSNIYVSSHLLTHILLEIDKISTVQPSRIESRKKLLSAIKQLTLEKIPNPTVPDQRVMDIEYSDYQKWIAAKEHNAFIVDDQFATEILRGRRVPCELESMRVYVYEVLVALEKMGYISNLTTDRYIGNRTARGETVQKLIDHRPHLLVDIVFLETLQDIDCLDAADEVFHLLSFNSEFDLIKNEQQALEKRQESVEWLKKLYRILLELKQEGKLAFIPVLRTDEVEKGIGLSRLINEMLLYGENNEIPLWCDDRNVNSYSKSKKAPVVGVFDMLEYLYECNYITQDEYRTKIHLLYSAGVKFKVPPVKYITLILKMAQVNEETELLVETSRLRVIRQSVLSALAEDSYIGKQKLGHVYFPELFGYILNLQKMLEDALYFVWTEPGKNEKWRAAASTWLLLNCSDDVGDIIHLTGNTMQIEKLVAMKHSRLICFGFRLLLSTRDNMNASNGYFKWLFAWLKSYWMYNPEVKKEALESVVRFITDIVKKDVKYFKDKYSRGAFLYFLNMFINKIPHEFRELLMEHTDIIELLNNDCKKVIIVKSLFSDIPVEIWQGWVNNAINRGAGRKGTELLKGKKVGITFIEGSLVTQHVLIEWQDEKGELHKVNILEPYAQLYHPNSDVRSGWLDLACNYIQFGEELEHYRESLKASQGYDVIINELIEMVESSPEFYFSRLELLIKSDTEKLPEDEILFPHKAGIFMNELLKIPLQEDRDGKQWLEYCIEHAKKHGVERTLSVLASLPLGGNWIFSVIIRKMVEKNIFDEHFVFNWCVESLKTTYNPVKQQNLITCLLQYTSLLNQEHFDLIINRLLYLLEAEVEINTDIVHYHKLYIALMKTAWRFTETIQVYDSYTQEQKILWSYIHADRVLGIFVKLQQGKLLPYDAKILADTFNKVVHKFTSNKRPLSSMFQFIPEVSHPEGASVWRTVIGGTLGVIQKNIGVLKPVKTALLPALKEIKGKCMSGVDGGEEFLLAFENVSNYFDTYFAENNLKRAGNIITAWGEEIAENFEPVDFYKSMLERLLSGEELNELYLTHLMVLARQPFPDELVGMVKDILEKNRLTGELNDEHLKLRGKMIFAVLNGFSQEVAGYFREKFKEDIKNIFILNPERWEVVAELLGSLYASDDYVVSGKTFIEALEEIVVQQSGIEIKKKFGEFINIMAWWMPARLLNKVHKLRRKFCW